MASNYFDKASLVMIPDAPLDGKVLSVKPEDRSGDFTFTRGSNLAATRVDVNGLIEKGRENLALQSNQFDTTWTNSSSTETGGQTGYDGSNDAWLLNKTSAGGRINQSVSLSGVQTLSMYAKAGSLNWMRFITIGGTTSSTYYDLENGTIGANISSIDTNIESVGNGWYRCSVTTNQPLTEIRIYPADGDNDTSGTSGSIYIQDAQLESGLVATDYIETGASTAQAGILEDLPRLDYSGGASCPSLLLEPQRTNLILQSEYLLSGSGWNTNYMNREANSVVSPDGSRNATKITPTTDNQIHSFFKTLEPISGHIYTAFVKANGYDWVLLSSHATSAPEGRGCFFYIADDDTPLVNRIGTHTSGNPSIEDYGNGWFRISINQGNSPSSIYTIIPTPADETITYAGDGTSGVYVYGFQREAGSYHTSYIPTMGSAVTRGRDECDLNSMSSKGVSTNNNLTILLDYKNFRSNQYATYFYSTGGEIMHIYNSSIAYRDASNVQRYVGDWTLSPYNDGETPFKIAFQYDGVNLTMFHNGVKKSSIANSNLTDKFADNFNRLRIAWHQNNPRKSINQVAFFDTALTDSECIALTTI